MKWKFRVSVFTSPSKEANSSKLPVRSLIPPHGVVVTKSFNPLDDLNPPAATPKVASIFGVKFHRTKNGNLVRDGIVQAQRYVKPARFGLHSNIKIGAPAASRRSTRYARPSHRLVSSSFNAINACLAIPRGGGVVRPP